MHTLYEGQLLLLIGTYVLHTPNQFIDIQIVQKKVRFQIIKKNIFITNVGKYMIQYNLNGLF